MHPPASHLNPTQPNQHTPRKYATLPVATQAVPLPNPASPATPLAASSQAREEGSASHPLPPHPPLSVNAGSAAWRRIHALPAHPPEPPLKSSLYPTHTPSHPASPLPWPCCCTSVIASPSLSVTCLSYGGHGTRPLCTFVVHQRDCTLNHPSMSGPRPVLPVPRLNPSLPPTLACLRSAYVPPVCPPYLPVRVVASLTIVATPPCILHAPNW